MQIQLREGTALRPAKAVPQGTTDDTGKPEIGRRQKRIANGWLDELLETIRWASRRRDTQCSEARGVLEFEKRASCGRADRWRRAKLDFDSSKPLEDLHWSSTLGTAIQVGSTFDKRRVFIGRRFLCCSQQLKAKGQGCGAASAGQETEVPDTYEALWK